MTQDASQNGAKLTIMGSKLANIAISWCHFGPTWTILATRWAARGLQIEPQMRSNSHLGPSWRQEGPQRPLSKTAPKVAFVEFSTILDTMFDAVSLIFHLHRILTWILPSMLLCSCSISRMNLKLQPQARHGGGLACSALDNACIHTNIHTFVPGRRHRP